ncbi:glycoside hydrolase [Fusarium solani]|uniref:Glycoside hydrolase n=2 Tax=Fusarium solani TaxID=169388 RepID=A0A9P9R6U7_FUSSL|nr:glycoside hydrolase [Fusarium solani]KAH7268012.1 glycoside hydrolase [Fusarium solani]
MPHNLEASSSDPCVQQLAPFWSIIAGAGRAAEGLRNDWQQHLQYVKTALGYKYVRFHDLFHDDMFVYNEVDGRVTFNFQYVDALIDAMLDIGVRPFVEFAFMPSAIATKLNTTFWWNGHGSPPTDLSKWEDMIRATMEHWQERYGTEKLEQWYFEVWNEPNLDGFWSGTRSQYYELYEATVKVVKGTGSKLRVGGPATSNFVPDTRFDGELEDLEVQKKLADVNLQTKDIDALKWKPVWTEHFLNWAHSRNLPVDFVSSHPYPTDWALDKTGNQSRRSRHLDATPEDLSLLREIVSKSPPSSRDHNHDYVPAATYLARTMLASQGKIDSIAYWTFTDVFEEEGAGIEPFHGGFSLVNLQRIPKPTFHAFRILQSLGDQILECNKSDGAIVRNSKSGLLSALLFHYPPELKTSPPPAHNNRSVAHETGSTGEPVRKSILIRGLRPGAVFKKETLTPGGQGDVVSAWEKLGSPMHLTRETTEFLRSYATTLPTELIKADSEGNLLVEQGLAPWTLVAINQIVA